MQLNLEPQEVQYLFELLKKQPNESGSYPLMMRIAQQAESQAKPAEPVNEQP